MDIVMRLLFPCMLIGLNVCSQRMFALAVTPDVTSVEDNASQAGGDITLDFSAEKLDSRIEVCNRLTGITRYFVKPGVSGKITSVSVNGHTQHFTDASRAVGTVLCAAPFNNAFTVQFSDNTSVEFTVTSDGISNAKGNSKASSGPKKGTVVQKKSAMRGAASGKRRAPSPVAKGGQENASSANQRKPNNQNPPQSQSNSTVPNATGNVATKPANVHASGTKNLGRNAEGGKHAGHVNNEASKTQISDSTQPHAPTSGSDATAATGIATPGKSMASDETVPARNQRDGHSSESRLRAHGTSSSNTNSGKSVFQMMNFNTLAEASAEPTKDTASAPSDTTDSPNSNITPPSDDNETVQQPQIQKITMTLGTQDPNILEDYLGEIPCYKAKEGYVINNLIIDGKLRPIGGYGTKEAVLCVVADGANYHIVVRTLYGHHWRDTYLSKINDGEILRDVRIRNKFANLNYSALFNSASRGPSSKQQTKDETNFSFNGRGNASLKPSGINSTVYTLETVEAGYRKKSQQIAFIDGMIKTPEGMNMIHMNTKEMDEGNFLIVSYRGDNVINHTKYVEDSTPGTYKKSKYLSSNDYDVELSIMCFDLSPKARLALLDTEQIESSAILYGFPIQKYENMSFINIPKQAMDTIVLLRSHEVLLKGNETHTVVLAVNNNGNSAQITSEKDGIVKRVTVTSQGEGKDAVVVSSA
ncbi:putative membrane protein [Babesia divergens]|uniref:Membrane protein n=1 Tax=Babesia divergens TaxID=32595 RepID=A0AAD9G6P0_BABDI|nr:putative membrane protein [Babesia divergens]